MNELPETWATCPFLSVADLLRGVTYTKADSRSEAFSGSVPVLRANNIQDRRFDLTDLVHVPKRLVADQQLVRRGDVVVATSSGSISVVGKAAQALEDMNAGFGAFCGLLRPKAGINAPYFGFFFSTDVYRKTVSALARGVNINNLKREHFESLELPIAPLAEQKRIADKLEAVLGRVHACRARLDRVPDLLKRFRQSVLAAATSGQLTEDWRQENGCGSKPWDDSNLGQLCEKDRIITYGVIKLGDETPNGVPCLRTSNVRWLRIDTTGMKRIEKSLSLDYSRTILKGGEVLVNVRGTLGGVAVAEKHMAGWNVSREVAVLPVDQKRLMPAFLAFSIGSDVTQRWLGRVEKGVAYTGINIEDLRELPVKIPSLPEQQEIVRRVEALFALADRIEARLATAQRLVERLTPATLSKAFRGDLVPQDPNDEPAAQLLERVRQRHENCSMPKKHQ